MTSNLYPNPNQASVKLNASLYLTLYLPTSPYIPLHLPDPDQASVKLNASSCTHRACRGAGACPGGRELVTRPRCAPLGAGPPSSRAAHRRVHPGAHSPRGAGAAQGEVVPAHVQSVGLGVEPTTLV